MNSDRMRWIILAACVFARSGIGFQFIAIAALMPIIRAEFSFSYTQVGLLLGLFMVTGIFLSIPSGMIAAKWGDRRTLFFGISVLVAAGGITAFSGSFELMLMGRVLGGIGAVFITVTAAKILTDWFEGREIATAMSFLGLSWPIGIGLGLSFLPILTEWSSWRWAVLITSALPLSAAIAALFIPKLGQPLNEKDSVTSSPPLWKITKRETVGIVIGGLPWPLMSSGGYVVFSSYAPAYFAETGMSFAEAGLALGMLSWLFLITIPVGGWLADRFKRGDVLIWIGCLVAAFGIALVPFGGPIIPSVMMAAVMGITVGPAMALPGQLLSDASKATGFGIFYTVYYLGTVVLPSGAGWLLDLSGSPAWVIWYAAFTLIAAPVFLSLCRLLQRYWKLGP